MEMVLSNNFAMLNENELLMVDGGEVNAWGVATGVFTIAAGVLTVAAAVIDPEPISKACAIGAGVSTVCAGITSIGWACS